MRAVVAVGRVAPLGPSSSSFVRRRGAVGAGDDRGDLGDVLDRVALVRQLHRGERDLHEVELVGERVDDDAVLLVVAVLQRVAAARRG